MIKFVKIILKMKVFLKQEHRIFQMSWLAEFKAKQLHVYQLPGAEAQAEGAEWPKLSGSVWGLQQILQGDQL